MDQYYVADEPQKLLMAQHYHSSLEEPNLENVEAKLYAARQRNHELAMNYFQKKYGSTEAYQSFVKTHNLGSIEHGSSQVEDLKKHLELKARQIERVENKRVRQQQGSLRGEEELADEPVLDFEFANPKKSKRASNNPWTQKKQTPSSTANKRKPNQIQQSQSFIVASAKNQHNKESQFLRQFKNYLMQKKEHGSESFDANNSTNKSAYGMLTSSVKEPSGKPVKEQSPKKQKSYEEELVKKIYRALVGECNEKTSVEKLSLVEYLASNQKILRVLGLSEQQLNLSLMSEYETKSSTDITMQEFLFFILRTVGKEEQINVRKQQNRSKKTPEGCMLTQQVINRFDQIFKELDIHTDLIVKRLQYTNRIAHDPSIKKYLNTPAVHEPQLDKQVTLRRVLERLEMEALLGSEEQQKVKEYISWNEFLDYFKSGNHDRSKYDLILLVETLKSEEKFGLLELPDSVMEIIIDGLEKQDEGSEYFHTLSLINSIREHPEFEHEKYSGARGPSNLSKLPAETFEEVLIRIKATAPAYMSTKELMEYFSQRGRPIEQFEANRSSSMIKNFSGVKVKDSEHKMISGRASGLDGYDSDPEMYSSKVEGCPRRTGRSARKHEEAPDTLGVVGIEADAQIANKQFKVTVPQPFSFEDREKNRLKNSTSLVSEQKYKPFRAKPIPAAVRDPNLYERMLEEDEHRINKRKKNCMIATLANERPFSFMERGTNKKTKEERREYMFKAKPIPWYCSVQILERKKQLEIGRNEKIAKQAQESLAKAKLPPRMERDYQEKLARKALIGQESHIKEQKKMTVYRDPPDFDKLHREFEEGLERKRKQNKVTQPQGFNFTKKSESQPKRADMSMPDCLADKSRRQLRNLEPRIPANSTAKFDQQVQKRREEMEQKRSREEKLRKEEEQRQIIDQDLKVKIQTAAKNKENKEKEQKQKREDQMKEEAKNFKNWKQERIDRGRKQPMLIERPLKRDEKIEKMRKLAQISKTLKDNGIKKKKDHDTYFTKQQLIMLQDWEQLKDRI